MWLVEKNDTLQCIHFSAFRSCGCLLTPLRTFFPESSASRIFQGHRLALGWSRTNRPACLTNLALVFIYVHWHAISCSITFTCQTVHHSDHAVLTLAHVFTPTVTAHEQRPWRQVLLGPTVSSSQCCVLGVRGLGTLQGRKKWTLTD